MTPCKGAAVPIEPQPRNIWCAFLTRLPTIRDDTAVYGACRTQRQLSYIWCQGARFELPTYRLQGDCSNQLSYNGVKNSSVHCRGRSHITWWFVLESNQRPSPCKSVALPIELTNLGIYAGIAPAPFSLGG